MRADIIQTLREIIAPAALEIGMQPFKLVFIERRGFVQPLVGAVVAGDDRQRKPMRARGLGQLLDAIAPIVETAQ